ncbi:GNAT family N-acetyltransferase [Rhodopila globiformis]|uniref:GNAT family N-acetyltransferase n=1 Tax=Rhodopila globiformis TaxID=1071 RepID=UPI001304C045|nr:GNAT family N-acetyltransferase [Rhodopila globiformis]
MREWARYHDIRKRCLFEKYNGKGTPYYFEYDPNHPDERDPANHPLVFLADGQVVGTIRIDLKPDGHAVFRLVAIDDPWQGDGLGSAMLAMAEAFAADAGADMICLNAVPDAYRFYTRHGFAPQRWVGCTGNPTEIPVVKPIAEAMTPRTPIPPVPVAVTAIAQAAA